MDYRWDFSFLTLNARFLLHGLGMSLMITVIVIMAGAVLGLLVALARIDGPRWLRWIAVGFIEFFRCTPPLIQLMWLYYALPIMTGLQPNALAAALIAFILYDSAYMAEIYRGGIVSIGRGQSEAGRVLGLTYVQRLRYVILPQAIRKMIPALTSQTIDVFKLSAIASLIAVNELVYNTRVVAESEFRPIEAYTALAIVYAVLLVPATYASGWFESRRKRAVAGRGRRTARAEPGALDLTIS